MRHTHSIAAVSFASLASAALAAPEPTYFPMKVQEIWLDVGSNERLAVESIDWRPGRHELGSWTKAEGLDVTWDVAEYRAGDAGNAAGIGAGFVREKPHAAPLNEKWIRGRSPDSNATPNKSGLSWSWGTVSPSSDGVSKVESFTMKQRVKPDGSRGLTTGGTSSRRPVGTSDLTMKRGTSRTRGAELAGPGTELPDPPPQGTMRVKVKMPWLACAEGKFIPQLIAGKPVKTYVLHDAVVTGCSASHVTIVYAKMEVQRAKPR